MPIDNGVWYARIGLFNNLSRYSFTYAKKTKHSSFNFFSEINALPIFILPCLSFLLLLTFLFSIVYIFLVFYLFTFENICCLHNSNISLIIFPHLTLYSGMLSNKHYSQMRLLRSGDVELNPGPRKSSSLSFLHWNVNGIAAHDFSKLALIQSQVVRKTFILGQSKF